MSDYVPPTMVPPGKHEWQEYIDGRYYCRACGVPRRNNNNSYCESAAKTSHSPTEKDGKKE